MVTTKLNLSMTEPQVRQIYAKQGDTGRVLDITLDQTPEDGTLRILRPDGVEVTSEAVTGGEISESGETVTFESMTEADVTELTVGIEPVQDLNGYDKPWVGGAGKNLFNSAGLNRYEQNGITVTQPSVGTLVFNGTATASAFFSIAGTGYSRNTYAISLNNTAISSGLHIAIADSSDTGFLDMPCDATNKTTTFTNEPSIIRLYVASGTTLSNFVVKPQLELGTTPTAWQPYSNICPITGHDEVTVNFGAEQGTADETYTTSLGQTVYGGTLDMVSGVLTVDSRYLTVDDFSDMPSATSAGGLHWVNVPRTYPAGVNEDVSTNVCSHAPYTSNGSAAWVSETPIYSVNAGNYPARIYVASASLADFQTEYATLQAVYKLAEPVTYQLTAQQIKTLVGTNNVWASSGDIVNITFTYGGLLSELPSEATEIVGKCYCDVEQNGVSSMPFTLNVKKNERES